MDDLICRQRILNELDRIISIGIKGKDGRTPISAEIFRDFVEAVPIIQPEQKIGRWKTRSEGRLHYCSECGWALMDTESGEPPYMGTDFNRSNEERWTCCPGWCGELMNFCPNCGAKMKSEDESNG